MEKCNHVQNPVDLTVAPVDGSKTIFGHAVSSLQTDLFIGNGKIVGTLSKITSGTLATDWGEGHFMAIQFGGPAFDDPSVQSIRVGMEPSVSSGLANVKPDPDKNGVFKVTNKIQYFKIVVNYGTHEKTYLYDLSGLTLAS